MSDIKNELMKKKALLEEYKKRKKEKELNKQNQETLAINNNNNFENLNADEILLKCGVVSQSVYPTPSSSSMSLISYSSSANSLHNLTSKSKNRLSLDHETINKRIEKLNLKSEVDLNKIDILPVEKIRYAKETQTKVSLFDESSHPDDEDLGNMADSSQNTPVKSNNKNKKKPQPLAFYEDVFVYDTFQWEDEFTPFNDVNTHHHHHHSNNNLNSKSSNQKNNKFYLGNENQDSDIYDDEDTHYGENDDKLDEKKSSLNHIDFNEFLSFMVQKRPIVERALRQNESNIFVDYTTSLLDDKKDEDQQNTIKIQLKKTFNMPDKQTSSSIITCLDWSLQYSELLLCSYDNLSSSNLDDMNDSEALVALWNAKSDQKLPQQTFSSTSLVTSCIFSPFHPSLIVGSTYSGQIVMWDVRSNKRTPVQRSSLSITSHVNPVYCVKVLQSQSLVSISNDGKLCTWSLENLNTPIESVDLVLKQPANRQVYASCLDFQTQCQNDEPQTSSNLQRNAIVGAEDGLCHSLSMNNKFGLNQTFEGHFGPVTSVNCFSQCSSDYNTQPYSVNEQLSKLFLTSSFDSTIRLWNMTENTSPVYTFESNGDYIYDAGWSPINPALFATVDGSGRLDFWNLNKETEAPTASIDIDNRTRSLNKLKWSRKGTEIAVGDDHGEMRIYEISENFARPSSDEYENLLKTLDNLKKLNQESINFNLNLNSTNDSTNYLNYLIESFR
ncbi:unnamed protein product [Brachionus calyciflorus]|uniref:Uncharacterized protein n=1 Tax=Brachionus calyciflorus TaxID=104777 RepID=A0A813NW26_9BILA|nr:unnamed protein product [Brachionus calyciflorus]